MTRRVRLSIGLLATIGIGVSTFFTFAETVSRKGIQGPPEYPPSIASIFGGAKPEDVIGKVHTIEAVLLKPSSTSGGRKPSDYVSASEAMGLSPADRETVLNLLTTRESYVWMISACAPAYGARLRISGDIASVDAYLCFQRGHITLARDGEVLGGGYFFAMRPQLARLLKRLFPADLTISGLDETKFELEKEWFEKERQEFEALKDGDGFVSAEKWKGQTSKP